MKGDRITAMRAGIVPLAEPFAAGRWVLDAVHNVVAGLRGASGAVDIGYAFVCREADARAMVAALHPLREQVVQRDSLDGAAPPADLRSATNFVGAGGAAMSAVGARSGSLGSQGQAAKRAGAYPACHSRRDDTRDAPGARRLDRELLAAPSCGQPSAYLAPAARPAAAGCGVDRRGPVPAAGIVASNVTKPRPRNVHRYVPVQSKTMPARTGLSAPAA